MDHISQDPLDSCVANREAVIENRALSCHITNSFLNRRAQTYSTRDKVLNCCADLRRMPVDDRHEHIRRELQRLGCHLLKANLEWPNVTKIDQPIEFRLNQGTGLIPFRITVACERIQNYTEATILLVTQQCQRTPS